ncbi:arsenite efflux transporter metallochaperone ArsD [Clostridium sp. CF012]|uniref:arsenite efflux transporter metallochaperone ArsD n=1 Tax=Clostridium sp. CF012 TaxID=2843319 RepID=UPI001C0A9D13|nr:arsenite efflux transporter metallochaperone ArsD [Clostridium sp. CF012]MBU3142673.1 arsenite efflux transporter metallochaperone ArsD [Clostridium sp. CF012]
MKKMQIFEAAMCCSTGLCGVGVDAELLRISTVLSALKKNGVEVERFNLSGSPQEFVDNKVINKFITEKGVDEMPITILDGEIVLVGRYPTNEEVVKFLEVPMSFIGEKPKSFKIKAAPKSGGCGCSGGDCC